MRAALNLSVPALALISAPALAEMGAASPGLDLSSLYGVQRCWAYSELTPQERAAEVTIRVPLRRDGTFDANTLELVESHGSPDEVARAYRFALQAIIRCGAKGFRLDPARYDDWKVIDFHFGPETMGVS